MHNNKGHNCHRHWAFALFKKGEMNKNKQISVSTLPRGRNIEQYPSYSPSTMQNQVIPVSIPIPSQQPKTIIQNSSQPLLIGGLTEEEVLNSYYKRVLLNTLV